jgi:hypothetical protein
MFTRTCDFMFWMQRPNVHMEEVNWSNFRTQNTMNPEHSFFFLNEVLWAQHKIYSYGTPILSLWFSSTWSHPHWAGTDRSEPEAAGVRDEEMRASPHTHPSDRRRATNFV